MFYQVCISFGLHRGNVVIPKSVTPSRIIENFKATEVRLDAEDMKRLGELGSKNVRYVHVRLTCYYSAFLYEFNIHHRVISSPREHGLTQMNIYGMKLRTLNLS